MSSLNKSTRDHIVKAAADRRNKIEEFSIAKCKEWFAKDRDSFVEALVDGIARKKRHVKIRLPECSAVLDIECPVGRWSYSFDEKAYAEYVRDQMCAWGFGSRLEDRPGGIFPACCVIVDVKVDDASDAAAEYGLRKRRRM